MKLSLTYIDGENSRRQLIFQNFCKIASSGVFGNLGTPSPSVLCPQNLHGSATWVLTKAREYNNNLNLISRLGPLFNILLGLHLLKNKVNVASSKNNDATRVILTSSLSHFSTGLLKFPGEGTNGFAEIFAIKQELLKCQKT